MSLLVLTGEKICHSHLVVRLLKGSESRIDFGMTQTLLLFFNREFKTQQRPRRGQRR